MTRDEILNMPAGREMDALVAEMVMGIDLSAVCDGDMYNEGDSYWSCTLCSKQGEWGDEFQHTRQPENYSTCMNAAWEVVEHIRLNAKMNKHLWLIGWTTKYDAIFSSFPQPNYRWWEKCKDVVSAETAPLAICRAALLAVLEDK